MSNERTPEQQMALEADYILSHPIFRNAFEKVKESYVEEIEMGDLKDEMKRDKMMLGLQNLRAIRRHIESHITDAEMAAQPLSTVEF